MRRAVVVWLLSCAMVSACSLQEPPPRTPPEVPTGTGRISGQVLAADNGAPVKRAVVQVSGRPIPRPGEARGSGVTGSVMFVTGGGAGQNSNGQRTDEAGRFEFTNLAAGRYSLTVVPQGGFVRLQRPHVVEVADGATATVSIRLDRTGVIVGRLLDESGDPVARAPVNAIRRRTGSLSRAIPTGPGALTDDLGHFRLFDLEPGEYYVSAIYREDRFGLQPAASSPTLGYVPTYYPGTAALTSAQAVTVRSGRETAGLDFSLARASLGRVSGIVRDSSGQAVSGRGGVNLTPVDGAFMGQQGAGIRADGTFIISNVAPGEYYISASIMRGEGPKAPHEAGYQRIAINGDDQHVELRLNTGATIRGRVIVEGTEPAMPPEMAARMPAGSSGLSVSIRPVMPDGPMGFNATSGSVQVGEDGTFELTGVRGRGVLFASGYRAVLKSVSHGSRDLTAKPIEFTGTERLTDVTIVLTAGGGTITGTVTTDRGEPAAEAFVIAFPEDAERFFQGSPFVRTTRALPVLPASAMPPAAPRPGMPPPPPRVPGGFSIGQLAPGRYLVIAVESDMSTPPPSLEPEMFEKLRGQATAVSVAEGQSATVALRALKSF